MYNLDSLWKVKQLYIKYEQLVKTLKYTITVMDLHSWWLWYYIYMVYLIDAHDNVLTMHDQQCHGMTLSQTLRNIKTYPRAKLDWELYQLTKAYKKQKQWPMHTNW